MAQTKLNMLLQMRRVDFTNETNAAWKPAQGEPCFCTVKHTFKVGDGEHTWAELPFANQSEIEALIKVVDDKVAALNDTFATDAEVEGIRAALDAAKLDKTTYNAYVEAHQNDYTNTQIDAKFNPYRTSADQDLIDATFALKADVATEFAKYTTTTAQQAIDAEQDRRIGVLEAKPFDTYATKTEVEKVATDLSDYETSNDARVKAIEDDYVTDTTYKAHLTAQAEVDGAQDDRLDALETKTQNIVCDDSHSTEMVAHNNASGEVSASVNVRASGANGGDVIITAESDVEVTGSRFTFNDVAVATANTVATAKQEAIDAVVGTDADTKDSVTVKGAKKYADALKAEVVEMIDGVASAGLTRSIVTELPDAADAALNTIYMIKRTAGLDEKDIYDEYIVIEVEGVKHFELLGNTELDLSNYYTKTDADTLFVENTEYVDYKNAHANDYTNTQIDNAISTAVSAEETRAEGTYSKIGHKHVVADITDYETDVASKIEAYNTATVAPIAAKVEGWDATKATVDANKSTWDKARTALQAADLADYAKTADVVTNEEFTAFEATNTEAIGKKLDTATFEAFNNGTSKNVAAIEADIVAKANAAQAAAEGKATELNTAMDARVAKLEQNDADYTNKTYVDAQDAATLQAAKDYANGLEHKDTTYAFAPTANALEFTVTPSVNGEAGVAETITLVAPTVDTGVMSVVSAEGDDVVASTNGSTVTVAHKTYGTGEYTAPETVDDTKFVTGVNVKNGHVIGASVKSLADALEAMTFILDGGTSIN